MSQYKRGNEQSDDDTVTGRVAGAVADALDTDPLELPPLYDVVDPDALDQLFHDGSQDRQSGPGKVIFTLAGCVVVVHSDGGVDVAPPEEPAPAPVTSTPEYADEQDDTGTAAE